MKSAQQPQCGLCAKIFEKHSDLKKHICEVAIKMHKEKSSVTLDHRSICALDECSSDDSIMEFEKENAENSNTNQDGTNNDSEFNSEPSINDTVSQNFHRFMQIAFIWEAALFASKTKINIFRSILAPFFLNIEKKMPKMLIFNI